MKINFFKLPSHRVFNHVPIYYDPAKDEQQEREKRVKQELGINADAQDNSRESIESRIKGKIRYRRDPLFSVARKEKKKSNRRLLIIILILLAVAYYMLKSSREWLELIAK
jgi:Flp pilus assembly protein TadB